MPRRSWFPVGALGYLGGAGFLLVLVLLSAVAGCQDRTLDRAETKAGPTARTIAPSSTLAAFEVVTVTRAVDGDTFDTRELRSADNKHGAVRLIGVDTPETHKPNTPVQCWGPEAAAHAVQILRPGLTVQLVYESGPNGQPDPRQRARYDRYGRTLAYVYLTDGTFWNRSLAAQGWAVARYYSPNDDHRAEFRQAMATAQADRAGLWGACAAPPPGPGP